MRSIFLCLLKTFLMGCSPHLSGMMCTNELNTELKIFRAVAQDNIPLVECLINNGISPNIHCQSLTLLHVASMAGNSLMVEALIEKGARVNVHLLIPEGQGYTPLHCALQCGHRMTALTLLFSGAPVNAYGRSGKSIIYPIDIAIQNNDTFMVYVLSCAGAKGLIRDSAYFSKMPFIAPLFEFSKEAQNEHYIKMGYHAHVKKRPSSELMYAFLMALACRFQKSRLSLDLYNELCERGLYVGQLIKCSLTWAVANANRDAVEYILMLQKEREEYDGEENGRLLMRSISDNNPIIAELLLQHKAHYEKSIYFLSNSQLSGHLSLSDKKNYQKRIVRAMVQNPESTSYFSQLVLDIRRSHLIPLLVF